MLMEISFPAAPASSTRLLVGTWDILLSVSWITKLSLQLHRYICKDLKKTMDYYIKIPIKSQKDWKVQSLWESHLKKFALFSNTYSPRQKNNNNNKKRKYENIPFKSITELEEEKYKYFKSFVFLPSGNIEEEQRGTLIKA